MAAFFDVDETLVRGATIFWAARAMFVQKLFGVGELLYAARQTFRYSLFGENPDEVGTFGERAAQVAAGNPVSELEAIAEDLYEKYFVPRAYQVTYRRLKEHLAAGNQVWLISASPWIITEVIAKHVGAAGGIGTRIAVEDGFLTPRLEGGLMHGEAKARVAETLAEENDIDLELSWAYSDAASDIPLLSMVGNPVAVNPDRELARYAADAGWEILDAREPWDHLKRFAIKTGLAVGAATVVFSLAGRVVKKIRR